MTLKEVNIYHLMLFNTNSKRKPLCDVISRVQCSPINIQDKNRMALNRKKYTAFVQHLVNIVLFELFVI